MKKFLRKLFSPRLGHNGSAASTPVPAPPSGRQDDRASSAPLRPDQRP